MSSLEGTFRERQSTLKNEPNKKHSNFSKVSTLLVGEKELEIANSNLYFLGVNNWAKVEGKLAKDMFVLHNLRHLQNEQLKKTASTAYLSPTSPSIMKGC